LPDGSGVDLIRQIRQQLGLGIPAIALSGYGMEEDIARCKEAGFDDHVTKPVNLQKLEQTIQRVAAAPRDGRGTSI
jgi:CheY-like chemotaxis protein